MDDRRFDSLVKALAEGRNRRSVLKGLIGLGGAAVIGGTVLEGPAEAARRPTPTPTPIKCPGNQIPVGGVCTCPASAPHQCNPGTGPACCTDVPGGPPLPTHTECCDNACCQGTCYGEELCCPTNNRSTGEFPIPPTHKICDTNGGPECCPFDDDCCLVDGCCATVCFGGSVDADSCCPVEDFCAGGSETDGICCTGNTTCCHGGTNQRVCLDLTSEGACCDRGDCQDPFCQVCNQDSHTCGPLCDEATEVCCTEQAGSGVCVLGNCCPGAPCGPEGNVCCPGATAEDPSVCIDPTVQCCVTADCPPADSGPGCEVECFLEEHVCRSIVCLEGQICCRDDAGFGTCVSATSCPCTDDTDCPDCQVCDQGTCVAGGNGASCVVSSDDDDEDSGICCNGECLSGSENFTCGDGCCPIADTCCEGECCTGECLRYSEAPDVCCTTLACLEGEARECCPNVEDYKCCGTKGCCTSSRCNEEADVCCPEDRFACGLVEGNECCDTATQKCCGGLCIPASECCPSTDGDCCVPLTCADVPVYSCPSAFSDGCGQTLDCSNVCPEPQFCNDSGWCDCELGQVCSADEECCSRNCCNGTCVANGDPCVSCDPYCECGGGEVDPATDGHSCNGGLDAGGGVCACGWCVVPLDGCPCGCDGDTECVECSGGQCVLINQQGSCNGGAGSCSGAYCV